MEEHTKERVREGMKGEGEGEALVHLAAIGPWKAIRWLDRVWSYRDRGELLLFQWRTIELRPKGAEGAVKGREKRKTF